MVTASKPTLLLTLSHQRTDQEVRNSQGRGITMQITWKNQRYSGPCNFQVGMTRYLLWGKRGAGLTLSFAMSWISCISSHHVRCSGARLQELVRRHFGGLWWIMTHPQLPLTWMPLPGVGGFTAESICIREYGCSLPLTRSYTTPAKFSSFVLGYGEICANLASADGPVSNGLLLNQARDDF